METGKKKEFSDFTFFVFVKRRFEKSDNRGTYSQIGNYKMVELLFLDESVRDALQYRSC